MYRLGMGYIFEAKAMQPFSLGLYFLHQSLLTNQSAVEAFVGIYRRLDR